MGGRDQSEVKIKFKKFEKIKSVPKNIPKSHNDDIRNILHLGTDKIQVHSSGGESPQVCSSLDNHPRSQPWQDGGWKLFHLFTWHQSCSCC